MEIKPPKAREFQVICFNIYEYEFAVDILKVKEIVMVDDIKKLPMSLDFVHGYISIKNMLVPIIDISERLSQDKNKIITDDARIIVTEIKQGPIGVLVDKVSTVMNITEDQIKKPPNKYMGVNSLLIKGVIQEKDKIFSLLELEHLLSDLESNKIKKAMAA
jgi:purine-binding chemotaxis protein CheW